MALLLLLVQTVAFGMGILFLTHSHSELKPFLCYPVFYYKQLVHSLTCLLVYLSTNLCSSVTLSFIRSNSFTCQPVYLSTCPLTCVLLLPCLLLQATRSLVNLVHSSTLSFITINSSTCPPCPLVYSHYYIYLPWNRFFCVVPLHRHQE